jgi:hypothetical protein
VRNRLLQMIVVTTAGAGMATGSAAFVIANGMPGRPGEGLTTRTILLGCVSVVFFLMSIRAYDSMEDD